MNLVIYTALFAEENLPLSNVGHFYPFKHSKGDVKYIAFTNRKDLKSDFWDVKYVDLKETSPRLDARYYKLNSHLVLPEHDCSLWMDSQVYFKYDPITVVGHYLQGYDIAMHHHSDITSLAHESIAQSWVYKNDKDTIIMPQMIRYNADGFPMRGYDHFETGILMRRNNLNVKKFNELWWGEVKNNSLRDQLSAPYVVWKMRKENVKVNTIKESFTAHRHSLPTPKSKMFFTIDKPKLEENLNNRN